MNKRPNKFALIEFKRENEDSLRVLSKEVKNVELAAKLIDLCKRLEKQSVGYSAEVEEINLSIRDIIGEIRQDNIKNAYIVMDARIGKIEGLLAERAVLCPGNSLTLTKADQKKERKKQRIIEKCNRVRAKLKSKGLSTVSTYTDDELLDLLLRSCRDERVKISEKIQSVHDALLKDKNDQYNLMLWDKYTIQLKAVDSDIENYTNETLRKTAIEAMARMDLSFREMVVNRKVSNEKLALLRKEHLKVMNERGKDMGATKGIVDDIINDHQSMDVDGLKIKMQSDTYATRNSMCGASESKRRDIYEDPMFKEMGVPVPEEEIRRTKIVDNAEDILPKIEYNLEDVNEKLREYQRLGQKQFYKCNNLLRQLDHLVGVERSVHEGEIDAADIDYDITQRKIDYLKNDQANLLEKKKIVANIITDKRHKEYLSDIQELNDIDVLKGIAVEMNEHVDKMNKELEQLGTINTVIDSSKVNTSTMSTRTNHISNTKNPNAEKYEQLKKKYGVSGD